LFEGDFAAAASQSAQNKRSENYLFDGFFHVDWLFCIMAQTKQIC
jgi:hypothetical protein